MSALETVEQKFGEIVDVLRGLVEHVKAEQGREGADEGEDPLAAPARALEQIRAAERQINSSLNKLCPPQRELKPLAPDNTQNRAHLEEGLLRHLLQKGHRGAAERLAAESPHLDSNHPLLSIYSQLDATIAEIETGSIDLALTWAREHTEFLLANKSSLFYDLHHLAFTEKLLCSRAEAIGYLRSVGREPFGVRVSGLPLELFKPCSRKFVISEARESFRWWFYLYNECSPASQLELATKAGLIALPYLKKSDAVMRARGAEWNSLDELPVSIPLPEDLQFHPVFVCPVSKEQTTSENPPYVLACGHVLALTSAEQLQANDISRSSFKCPYCPERDMVESLERVVFSSE